MLELQTANGTNHLLASLEQSVYDRLAPHLEPIFLPIRHVLYECNQPIEHVYFPVSGMVSLLAQLDKNKWMEVATVGNEGMVGLPLLLGTDRTPGRSFSQISGDALRMPSRLFRDFISQSEVFTDQLHRYTQALMVQISQGNACNRAHSIEERCARWLLFCRDRVGADEFHLTQEFLSQMLGVRRAGVNLVATTLQKAGLIQYTRGHVRILNSRGVEAVSCKCYEIIRQEYDRLLITGNASRTHVTQVDACSA